jgi:uncharacterized protein YneF (UPF0154 family)
MSKTPARIIETLGWLQILASSLLIGLGAGIFVYLQNPTNTGLTIGILIASAGLIIGILLATKYWKTKEGTMGFLSRVMATPELDKKENESDDTSSDNRKDSV